MKVNVTNLWKYITATAISFALLFAMMMMFGSTISNQANRLLETPVAYRTAVDCN